VIRRSSSARARRRRRRYMAAARDASSPVELRYASGAAHRHRRPRRTAAPVVITPYAHRLVFSIRRARKRRRRRRVAAALVVASVVTIALRIPGSDASLRLIEDFLEDRAAASEGPESSESTASMLRFRRSVFRSRPDQRASEVTSAEATGTGTETSAEPAAPPTSITDVVYAAAAEFGISGDYLLSVASCESALDPLAYNAAGYHGLFQFNQQTWAAYGYGWIYDPVAQARTAARLLVAGHTSRWPNCA